MSPSATELDRARDRRANAQTRRAHQLQAAKEKAAAVVVDPEEALQDYETKFLECRDIGHPWRIMGFFRMQGEIRRSLICQRCNTESTDVWRPNGERIGRRYKYVPGYQLLGTHVSRFHVRRETLNRVTVFESQAEMVAALFTKRGSRKAAG